MGNSFYRGSPMSRGLVTAPGRRGGATSPIAGIGSVVADLVSAAMYDPEKDPRVQSAALYGAKTASEQFELEQAKAQAARAEQARALISGVTDAMGLGDIAPQLAALDMGTPDNTRGAGDAAQLVVNLMGGTTDQTDAAWRAAGGRPDQTREALGYTVDTDATTKRRGQDITSGDDRYNTDRTVEAAMFGHTTKADADRYGYDQRLAGTKYDADVRSGDSRYDTDVDASTALDVAGLVEVPGIGPDGKPSYTNRAGLAGGNAAGVQPMVSETNARGAAFMGLPGRSQAQAVGPTKEEVVGDMLSADEGTLSPEQRAAVYGAEPKIDGRAPMNYVVQGAGGNVIAQGRTIDGRTDATTGESLPQNAQIVKREATGTQDQVLTTSQRGNLEQRMAQLNVVKSTVERMRAVASDPTVFGTVGNVLRFGQSVQEQMAAVGLIQGTAPEDVDAQYEQVFRDFVRNKGNPELLGGYNPNLDTIKKLSTVLTYQTASALFDQSGRGASDQDIARMAQLVGDPTGWLTSQQSVMRGLDLIEGLIADTTREFDPLRSGARPAGGAPAAPAVDPEIDALLKKYGG